MKGKAAIILAAFFHTPCLLADEYFSTVELGNFEEEEFRREQVKYSFQYHDYGDALHCNNAGQLDLDDDRPEFAWLKLCDAYRRQQKELALRRYTGMIGSDDKSAIPESKVLELVSKALAKYRGDNTDQVVAQKAVLNGVHYVGVLETERPSGNVKKDWVIPFKREDGGWVFAYASSDHKFLWKMDALLPFENEKYVDNVKQLVWTPGIRMRSEVDFGFNALFWKNADK